MSVYDEIATSAGLAAVRLAEEFGALPENATSAFDITLALLAAPRFELYYPDCEQVHLDYAYELLKAGKVPEVFPTFNVRLSNRNIGGTILTAVDGTNPQLLTNDDRVAQQIFFSYLTLLTGDHVVFATSKMVSGIIGLSAVFGLRPGDTSFLHYPAKLAMPLVEGDQEEIWLRSCKSAFWDFMSFLGVLSTKEFEVTETPAPAKLNAKRLKRGKPPLGPTHTICLKKIHREGTANGNGVGYRKSPRLHWRRGHVRVLHRGMDSERVITVSPVLVNARKGVHKTPQVIYKM